MEELIVKLNTQDNVVCSKQSLARFHSEKTYRGGKDGTRKIF
jgi:hypothetical protein